MLSIAVMGAGCVGAWLGGRLAAAGHEVVLIGRERLKEAVDAAGLEVVELGGRRHEPKLTVELSAHAAADADIVLVTVKGRDSTAAGLALAGVLPTTVPVVSFQNGLHNADRLKRALPDHQVLPGMVGFNVVRGGPSALAGVSFRQASSGPLAVLRSPYARGLAQALSGAGIDLHLARDMEAVQWAKLILNLNNAINALSGLPLRDQLADRGYRRILAAAMAEAWTVLDQAGVQPAAIGRMRPRLAPRVLPLPDPLFRILAAPMIRIDPAARSSMADDLARGRGTEVDDINGEVVALGRAHGLATPVNQRLLELIHECEEDRIAPGLRPDEIWPG